MQFKMEVYATANQMPTMIKQVKYVFCATHYVPHAKTPVLTAHALHVSVILQYIDL